MDGEKTILSAFSIHCEWSRGIEHRLFAILWRNFSFFFSFRYFISTNCSVHSVIHLFVCPLLCIIPKKFYSLFMRIGHRSVIVHPTPSNVAIHYPYYIVLCTMCVVRCALFRLFVYVYLIFQCDWTAWWNRTSRWSLNSPGKDVSFHKSVMSWFVALWDLWSQWP